MPLCVFTTFKKINLLTYGYLGCFHPLAIGDAITMGMKGMKIYLQGLDFSSLGWITRHGIAGSYNSS